MLKDAKNLVSPITGGLATLEWESREVEFRKEKFLLTVPYYVCEDTKQRYSTTESDGVWMAQLRNQYCHRHGIPYTDEIVAVRAKYGLSALKMSLILGIGENQWRRYEQEEIPNLSNGRLIRAIMNPDVFLDLVESSRHSLSEKDFSKIVSKIKAAAAEKKSSESNPYTKERLFRHGRSSENGYGQTSLTRLKNILLYILQHCGSSSCTKLNSILFYLDFCCYREAGIALSGLTYIAAESGPEPENWPLLYSTFDEISHTMQDDCSIITGNTHADIFLFTTDELDLMHRICNRFIDMSGSELASLSRKEKAWIDFNSTRAIIPFEAAFELSAI